MKFLKNILKKKQTPIGHCVKMSWNEVVDACYDKHLDCFVNDVIKVIYSDDKVERAVILQRPDKLYSITFEKLCFYYDDELKYLTPDSLPAYWCPNNSGMNSIFDTEEEALSAIMTTPPFKYCVN